MKKKYLLVAATALVLSIVTGFYINSLTAKALNDKCPRGENFPNGCWIVLEKMDSTPPANHSLTYNETDIYMKYAVEHPREETWMGMSTPSGFYDFQLRMNEFRSKYGDYPDYIYWEPTEEYYNMTSCIEKVGGLPPSEEVKTVSGACLASAWGLFSIATVAVVRKEKQRNG